MKHQQQEREGTRCPNKTIKLINSDLIWEIKIQGLYFHSHLRSYWNYKIKKKRWDKEKNQCINKGELQYHCQCKNLLEWNHRVSRWRINHYYWK